MDEWMRGWMDEWKDGRMDGIVKLIGLPSFRFSTSPLISDQIMLAYPNLHRIIIFVGKLIAWFIPHGCGMSP
jgi:hypothetical protein